MSIPWERDDLPVVSLRLAAGVHVFGMTATSRGRTAEDARNAILDAAEQRLIDSGPASIRLQEVAADVGVGHPTVLHHFGSREALVDAVVQRALDSVHGQVLSAIAESSTDDGGFATLFDKVASWLSDSGRGRLFYWLALEGIAVPDDSIPLQQIVAAAHDQRLQRARERGCEGAHPLLEDTRFTVVLTVLAITAQGILGPRLLERVGVGADERAQKRFRAWLGEMILRHLDR